LRPRCLQKLVELTYTLKHSLQESVNKIPNEIGKTRYYKTIFLYETIRMLNLYETLRRLKYLILQKSIGTIHSAKHSTGIVKKLILTV
jgi:hypothetical protein